jgi:hypothetical protein
MMSAASPVRKCVQFNVYYEHENETGKEPTSIETVWALRLVFFQVEKK